MPSLSDIRRIRGEILRVAAKHGAGNVRLFGSIVRGEAKEGSDVDVLVHLDDRASLLDHIARSARFPSEKRLLPESVHPHLPPGAAGIMRIPSIDPVTVYAVERKLLSCLDSHQRLSVKGYQLSIFRKRYLGCQDRRGKYKNQKQGTANIFHMDTCK